MDAAIPTFPFGQAVLPVPMEPPGHRDCLVLGSLPGALCVHWRMPDGRSIQGLPVDQEPAPYWDGHDQEVRIRTWRQTICWRDTWGTVGPTPQNGRRGHWLHQEILVPLRLGRDRICAIDLIDRYHANAAIRHRIDDSYRPLIYRIGIPLCHLPPPPGNEEALLRAISVQRDQVLDLLETPTVQTVITLGVVPARALSQLLDQPAARVPASVVAGGPDYGQEHLVAFHGRQIRWRAFICPGSPGRMLKVHTAWTRAGSAGAGIT